MQHFCDIFTNVWIEIFLRWQISVCIESACQYIPVHPLDRCQIPEQGVQPILSDPIHPAGSASMAGWVIRALQIKHMKSFKCVKNSPYMVLKTVPESQLRIGNDGSSLNKLVSVLRVLQSCIPLSRGLYIPHAVTWWRSWRLLLLW